MMTPLWRSLLMVICATSITSCYYPAYDDGYSSGIGYVGGGATFIHTSSDRWFYDSSVRCYYDRTRHCYYDPWLNGYYPRGYCPRPVVHVPHPYGWSGRGVCPPPRAIQYRQINRHQDRVALLRAQNHAWSPRVQAHQRHNSQQWADQRARQAAQFASNRNRGNRSSGLNSSAPRPQPNLVRNSGGSRPPSTSRGSAGFTNPFFGNQARPSRPQTTQSTRQPTRPQASSPSRQPSRPQATRPSRQPSRPQATQPSRQPSRSTPPPVTRPGYRQPVKTTTPQARPTRGASPNAAQWNNMRSTPRRKSR